MVGARSGPMGPTKVVAKIGHRSSDEEGTRVRRTIEAKHDVNVSLSTAGAECNPRKKDSLGVVGLIHLGSIVWEDFNANETSRRRRGKRSNRSRSITSLARAVVRNDRQEDRDRQKRYTGRRHRLQSVAASAEKIISCRICRSWREHRPVYGPSLDICFKRSAR